jgi:hypothetical protein
LFKNHPSNDKGNNKKEKTFFKHFCHITLVSDRKYQSLEEFTSVLKKNFILIQKGIQEKNKKSN